MLPVLIQLLLLATTLSISLAQPQNDFCQNALPFGSEPIDVITTGSTPTILPYSGLECGDFTENGDVWFTYTAPRNGKNVRLHTCSEEFDTVLDVYFSCDFASFVEKQYCDNQGVQCGRGGSQLHINLEPYQTIFVRVFALDPAYNSTSFQLHHNIQQNQDYSSAYASATPSVSNSRHESPQLPPSPCPAAEDDRRSPRNDLCENALPFRPGPMDVVTAGATPTVLPLEGLPCGDFTPNGDVWFQYTAPRQGKNVRLHTCSEDFDSVVDVYTSCDLTAFSEKLDCLNDNFFCGRHGQQTHVHIPGFQTIYVRVYAVDPAYNSTPFQLHHNLQDSDLDATQDPGCPGLPSASPTPTNVPSTIPTASPIAYPSSTHLDDVPCDFLCFNGICVNNTCTCLSGTVGPNCSEVVDHCEGQWIDSEEVLAGDIYIDELSGVRDGVLTLIVHTPLVSDGALTLLRLGDTLNSFCHYPVSTHWEKLDDGSCSDTFRLTIPWNVVTDCGWIQINETDPCTSRFTTSLSVIYASHLAGDSNHDTEVLDTAVRNIAITIDFPCDVNISTNLTAIEHIHHSAITTQIYLPEWELGIIDTTIYTAYPYILTNPVVIESPPGTSASVEMRLDWNSCLDSTEACMQNFLWTINPHDMCSLSGVYRLQLEIACLVPDCILPDETETVVELVITSEDLCAGLEVEVGLTGTLQGYVNPRYSIATDSFEQGQTAFLRTMVSSDAGLTISNTVLSNVRLFDGRTLIYLMQNGETTPQGSALQFSVRDNPVLRQCDFSFIPPEPLLIGGTRTWTVTATVDVYYLGQSAPVRRDITLQPRSDSMERSVMSKTFLFEPSQSSSSSPSLSMSSTESHQDPNPTNANTEAYDNSAALRGSAWILLAALLS